VKTARLPLLLVCASLACGPGGKGEGAIRRALQAGRGVIELPAGDVQISAELVLPPHAHDLEIRGSARGTVLRAAAGFRGAAIFVCRSGRRIRFRDFTIDGNRGQLAKPIGIAPSDVPFSRYYSNNGLLAEDADSLAISGVNFREVANLPILVSRSRNVTIERVGVERCGSLNEKRRNNTTGGILLEEGTSGFQVLGCRFEQVRGNAVWTHSLYTSPRNQDGRIAENSFQEIGRDAIQVGHATRVRVEDNEGRRIGYPPEEVDIANLGVPVAIDTAGDVDHSVYAKNRFEEVDGQCIDLDGFHDGEVRGNVCVNRGPVEAYPYGHYGIVLNNSNPDMRSERIVITENRIEGAKFGGVFLIGSGHTVERNRFLRLNMARCGCLYKPDEPELLQSGIYLGSGAARPEMARNNVIRDNEISGYKMRSRCFGFAPGVSRAGNTIARNRCADR
jgi:hypothetical protein